ncbi:MAG: hypothetical protein KF812_09270, partial [Fimbriimonadaceae bacterium]|nr:hypothetical protein [Fimbriimonadaceae bacterium]
MQKAISVLGLVGLLVSIGSAQHASTTDGRGTYLIGNTSHDIREVTVILTNDNKVQIGTVGNARVNFNGVWTDVRGSTYT